eukprot:1235712-Rhodomonas_salina.5
MLLQVPKLQGVVFPETKPGALRDQLLSRTASVPTVPARLRMLLMSLPARSNVFPGCPGTKCTGAVTKAFDLGRRALDLQHWPRDLRQGCRGRGPGGGCQGAKSKTKSAFSLYLVPGLRFRGVDLAGPILGGQKNDCIRIVWTSLGGFEQAYLRTVSAVLT